MKPIVFEIQKDVVPIDKVTAGMTVGIVFKGEKYVIGFEVKNSTHNYRLINDRFNMLQKSFISPDILLKHYKPQEAYVFNSHTEAIKWQFNL